MSSLREQIPKLSHLSSAATALSDEETEYENDAFSKSDELLNGDEGGPVDFSYGSLRLKTDFGDYHNDKAYQGVKINRSEGTWNISGEDELAFGPEAFHEKGLNVEFKFHDDNSTTNSEDGSLCSSSSATPAKIDSQGVSEDNEIIDSFSMGSVNEELSKAQNSELLRGIATRNQLGFSDKLLELRIKLQKPLQSSWRFPQCDNIHQFQNLSAMFSEEQNEVKAIAMAVLAKLLALHEALKDAKPGNSTKPSFGNPSIRDSSVETENHVNVADNAVEEVQSFCDMQEKYSSILHESKLQHSVSQNDMDVARLSTHRSSSLYPIINKWDDKLRFTSGKGMKKKFLLFDRSTLSQVKQVMLDKKRLIRRTKLKRSVYRTFGIKRQEVSNDTDGKINADTHLQAYDDEIFDDDDFYHQVLKEFIGRSLDPQIDSSVNRNLLNLQALQKKSKDRKIENATKGRKIRYNVHSKLLNFMTPISYPTGNDQSRTDLFKSVFGGKSSI